MRERYDALCRRLSEINNMESGLIREHGSMWASSHMTNKLVRNILSQLQQEDTGHIGDEIESNIVDIIADYFCSKVDSIHLPAVDEVITEIIPLISENKSEEVIEIIEDLEDKIKHNKW